MSYTPGPWRKANKHAVITDDLVIALARGNTPDESEANARLIAAAPDMLAALQEAARLLNTLTTDEYQHGGDRRIRDLLAATIARAIGEA